jgi:predicted outer membrane protein
MRIVSNMDVEIVRFKKDLKDQAHKYFDMLWQFKYVTRDEAYVHLANWMGVTEPEAHMRAMKPAKCKEVIEWSIMMLNDMRRLDLDFGAEVNHPYFELVTPKLIDNQ